MKKLIIILMLIAISFSKQFKYPDVDYKIIKYKSFGKIKYDSCHGYTIKGNYCQYYNLFSNVKRTNTIHGEFEIISYKQYRNEVD